MEEKKEERSIVKNELEATMAPTFHVFPLYRTRKQQGRRVKVEVGTFKGGVRVYEKGAKVDPPIDLKALYAPAEYVVRAYVLEGFQLVPKVATFALISNVIRTVMVAIIHMFELNVVKIKSMM